jgi:hypothetical protein
LAGEFVAAPEAAGTTGGAGNWPAAMPAENQSTNNAPNKGVHHLILCHTT